MKITERTLNDITVLELDGELAQDGNAQFRKTVNAALEAGARKLIVNLAQVGYMDSSGLGELTSCYTNLKKLGGRLTLLQVNHRLQHLLVITKLHTVFETFESEPVAIASFTALAESEMSGHASAVRLS